MMRVEVLALLRRYAGTDRRSGLVPPVPARSCAHTAARASHVAMPRGLPSSADGLPGIHVGDERLSVLHPEDHRAKAFFGAAGPQKVDEAIRRSGCCHAERW